MMHISELKNIDNLDSMESGLLHTIQYYDIIQIRVPKGYNIPIELLNLTPYEWKDLLNKAAKSHVEQIISQTHNSPTHIQPLGNAPHNSPTHIQPLGNAPHNSQPVIQILNDTTDYYSEQQIANYYCLGQTSKIHPLDKYHLDKQTHHDQQQIEQQQIKQQIEQQQIKQQIEQQQIDQQSNPNKDIKNQNNSDELYPNLTQSYKSLQCVVC